MLLMGSGKAAWNTSVLLRSTFSAETFLGAHSLHAVGIFTQALLLLHRLSRHHLAAST